MNQRFQIFLLLLLFSFAPIFVGQTAHAQIPGTGAGKTDVSAAAEEPADELGRSTPRGTIKGFLKAVVEENYVDAAQFLDLGALSRTEKTRAATYAQNLQRILDKQGWINPDGNLSDHAEGKKDDGLEPNFDEVGTLRASSGNTPILVERITGPNNQQIWLISPDLVEKIPEMSRGLEDTYADKLMIGQLDSFKIYGTGIGHWILMLGLYVVAYMISGFLVRAIIRLVRRFFRHRNAAKTPSEKHLIDEFETPLRLYAMVWIASLSAAFMGVSLIVRHSFMPISTVIAWIAIGLFFWRLADLAVSLFERRMAAKERYSLTSALAFARRGLKFISVIIIVILVLSSFGVDVTAGLAALGIGGIALALGAQKTLENFIGSLSIIADQPFHVGDFCKIGEVSGTVEDIGMRSTRLRTNDRTLVTIPNGDLSSQRIENFARRTRFLINKSFVLRYDSTTPQIRKFMALCNDIFKTQDKIVKEGTMVRFLGFVDNGHQIQFWANVNTGDYNEYVAVQADIFLQVIDAAWACGLYFAIPSQTFLPAKDQTGGVPPEAGYRATQT